MARNIIYCPDCARELFRTNGRQTMPIIKRCACGNFYKIDTKYLTASRVSKPTRLSSSGVTFY